MKFPIIVFTKNDKTLWVMQEFIADKRVLLSKSERNSNLQIIDSEGNLYFIKNLVQEGNILFWESIKNLGQMVKVNPQFEKDSIVINLEDLKIRISNHVTKNKNYWKPLDEGRGINAIINGKNNFKDLILTFN